jgi:hypothetical protein
MACASFSSAKVIDHTLVIVNDFSNPYISNQPFQRYWTLLLQGDSRLINIKKQGEACEPWV